MKRRYYTIKEALNTVVAVMLCWSFEAFDFMLFPMLGVAIMHDISLTKVSFGTLISSGLLGTMVGGIISGVMADRLGRRKVLITLLLVYGLGTLAIALAKDFTTMFLGRFIVGFGLGAEWSTGMTLISEIIRPEMRGRAVGLAQAGWPLGVLMAISMVIYVYPSLGWRGCFLLALVAVVFIAYLMLKVPESELWMEASKKTPSKVSLIEILKGELGRKTILALTMNVFAMFSYWMFWSWIPTYLFEARGMSIVKSAKWLVITQVGAWAGYTSYGVLQDHLGRRVSWSLFTCIEALAITLFVLYPLVGSEAILIGIVLGYFTGYWSGFGALLSELFPTYVRNTALGFIFNTGRAINFVSPIIIAWLSDVYGWTAALMAASLSALAASLMVWTFPETKGLELK